MPWTTAVTLDKDKTDVGNVSATFTDTDDSTFTHSGRTELTIAGRNAFAAAAIAARNAWQTRKTSEASLAANLLTRIEEVDV